MGWSVGHDSRWQRDVGYGVPATCDRPGCGAEINRSLGYVCGGEPYGGEHGCGLCFCTEHRRYAGKRRGGAPLCERCYRNAEPFPATPDVPEWIEHKLTDESWQQWRDENLAEVERLRSLRLQEVAHG